MTTEERRLVPTLLLGSCSLLITVLVWSITLHFTPTFMTLASCLIWTTLWLRYVPQQMPTLFGTLVRFGWIGLVTLGGWWAFNNFHP